MNRELPGWASTCSDNRDLVPVKAVLDLRKERNTDGAVVQILSLTADRGVILYEDKGDIGNKVSEDISRYSIVHPGDIVLNSMNVIIGSVGLSAHHGALSPVYYVMKPRDPDRVDIRFLAYHFDIAAFQKQLIRIGYGILDHRMRIPWINLREETLILPPLAEQRAIADYLDTETTRIDALIAKKRRMIELLEERTSAQAQKLASRQTAIGQGSRLPLSSVFRIRKGVDAQRLTSEYCAQHPGLYPVYSGMTSDDENFGNIDTFDFHVANDAIVVSTVGAKVMSQRVVTERFSLSQNCLVLIPHQPSNVLAESLVPQLRSLFLTLRASIPDHMQPSLRVEDLRGVWLRVPPIEAQRELIDRLRSSASSLRQLRSLNLQQLALLTEHRQALITSLVTGEMAVSELAA